MLRFLTPIHSDLIPLQRLFWAAFVTFSFFPGFAMGQSASIAGRQGKIEAVKTVEPVILRFLDHDPDAFTQGLIFYEGRLYESTGQYGKSSLRILDIHKGRINFRISLPHAVFGEGLAARGDKLVQLSWKEGIAFTYALPGLAKNQPFSYAGEGWGLASDGKSYFMSNGSDTLYRRDSLFAIRGKTPVTLNGKPLTYLNELEYAAGSLYANVWHCDSIFEIGIRDGKVTRVIDCRRLAAESGANGPEDVLNGIAFDPGSRTFYLTGKNWNKIFHVRVPN